MAQRVMDCGDAGHILLSRRLCRRTFWNRRRAILRLYARPCSHRWARLRGQARHHRDDIYLDGRIARESRISRPTISAILVSISRVFAV
jgi:hypothetical protein